MDTALERIFKLTELTENREVSREASEQTDRKMLREAIGASGLNNFESILNAVEEFLSNVQLFDPSIAFGRAADALGMVALAFAVIDIDHDRRLSDHELAAYANRLDDRSKVLLEWILCHYDAIQRAGLVHEKRGISRSDLASAAGVFRGLEYVHANFEKLASQHDGRKIETLTHRDIQRYLDAESPQLDHQSRAGLSHLARYLRKLEMKHSGGFSDVEFDAITPEMLWTG